VRLAGSIGHYTFMAMTVLAEKDHTSFEPATTFNAADRKLAISKNGGP